MAALSHGCKLRILERYFEVKSMRSSTDGSFCLYLPHSRYNWMFTLAHILLEWNFPCFCYVYLFGCFSSNNLCNSIPPFDHFLKLCKNTKAYAPSQFNNTVQKSFDLLNDSHKSFIYHGQHRLSHSEREK